MTKRMARTLEFGEMESERRGVEERLQVKYSRVARLSKLVSQEIGLIVHSLLVRKLRLKEIK